jgi:hypothetical protein
MPNSAAENHFIPLAEMLQCSNAKARRRDQYRGGVADSPLRPNVLRRRCDL